MPGPIGGPSFPGFNPLSRVTTPAAPAAPARPSGPAGVTPVDSAAFGGAVGVGPTEALKLVRTGDIALDMPMKAGDLGPLTVAPGTTLRVALTVRDGNIDFANSRFTIQPPLTGPLGVRVTGATFRPDGRAEVDVRPFPNLVVGDPAPAKLADFMATLQTGESVPVKLLGFTVKELHRGASAADPTGGAKDKLDLANTKVQVGNLSFLDGAVPLGNAGRVRLGPDSKVSLQGTLSKLALQGHVSVKDLDFKGGGTQLTGAEGTADVAVEWAAAGSPGPSGLPTDGTLTAKFSNLAMRTDSAVSRRPNGDFLELAQGTVEGGSLSVRQTFKGGQATGTAEADVSFGRFQGTVEKGQLTVPDGDGTAQVVLRRSTLDGSVEVTDRHVRFAGQVALDADVLDYDAKTSGTGKSAHVDKASVKGDAQVDFDTFQGVNLSGHAVVDVTARGVDVGAQAITLTGGAAHLTGTSDVKLDANGLGLTGSALQLTASVEDGKVALGDTLSLDLKAGTKVDAAVTQAFFGPRKVALDLSRAHLDAELDGGQVKLPGGSPLDFKSGTKVSFTLDHLSVPEAGIPEASGSLSLTADLSARQIDPATLARVPGVQLTSVQGVQQQVRLDVGRFTVARTGAFEVTDMKVGVEASVQRFTGVIH